MKHEMPERDQLRLEGGISILQSALRRIPTSGWRGSDYYTPTEAERQAWRIISNAAMNLSNELRRMYSPQERCHECGQVKRA